ncbi:hypothetical protein BFJ63_vAg2659 [Fusarium oxysporum f. sp. narcissi]|uniref:Uncharacterized protein n=6 Tax=Fusarium oxysporum TaxID=5507 RepID=A0A2H3I305_FUSOX|nr:hypothetical protein FOZG_07194 [Fusarium oxysporum Fo47]KAK2485220.1 hypothetical protein H9L39_03200 [Fusarium oxysporum f. sp. albedinis]PCD43772.1 hypothetical protein AU210_002861 [Fusarium oxysporum f. sp. radicis-cucumerinum]RKK18488.1 hypothetical protein BFJ65_g8790 [Fusarium oxysporum f. sp. cepae]RKL02887.1 hypothetical protein BFJ71_g4487 [Fusarium oxysporum]RYC94397.1 hypothetical protein BFJ63_vAg2659 [Fusarium oxysporum f. sp. narcissi]
MCTVSLSCRTSLLPAQLLSSVGRGPGRLFVPCREWSGWGKTNKKNKKKAQKKANEKVADKVTEKVEVMQLG